MISSPDIDFFIVVSGSRSLAAAARSLNVTPPSVSLRLQNIERKLGVELVKRSARSISLTKEGQLLAKKGRTLLNDLEALQHEITAHKFSLTGRLKIVSPFGLGVTHIAPLVEKFQDLYPDIQVELSLSDRPKWQYENSPDVMFYIGQLQDSSLIRIVLAKNRRLLLASPGYMSNAPKLNHPTDLRNHRCIVLKENDEDTSMWRFKHASTQEEISTRVTASLSSNVGLITKRWGTCGKGIIQRSEWDVKEELASGSLIEVLPHFRCRSADIVALVDTEQSKRAKKITTFLDYARKYFYQELGQPALL